MDWSIPIRVLMVETDSDDVRRYLASKGYPLYNPFMRPLSGAELRRGKAKVPLAYQRTSGNELFVHRDLLPDIPRRIAACEQCEKLPVVDVKNAKLG